MLIGYARVQKLIGRTSPPRWRRYTSHQRSRQVFDVVKSGEKSTPTPSGPTKIERATIGRALHGAAGDLDLSPNEQPPNPSKRATSQAAPFLC